jgi:hypothetical protein
MAWWPFHRWRRVSGYWWFARAIIRSQSHLVTMYRNASEQKHSQFGEPGNTLVWSTQVCNDILQTFSTERSNNKALFAKLDERIDKTKSGDRHPKIFPSDSARRQAFWRGAEFRTVTYCVVRPDYSVFELVNNGKSTVMLQHAPLLLRPCVTWCKLCSVFTGSVCLRKPYLNLAEVRTWQTGYVMYCPLA